MKTYVQTQVVAARATRSLLAAALLAMAVLASPPAARAQTREFQKVFTGNLPGQLLVVGNSVVTCNRASESAADCNAVETGAGAPTLANDTIGTALIDIDAVATTVTSSAATLNFGGTVEWAGLYWWGSIDAADATRTVPTAARGEVKLGAPGAAYATVTSNFLVDGDPYLAFANVTDLVRAGGPGVYTVADVVTFAGNDDHFGGWSLVVVNRDSDLPLRHISVYDGYKPYGGTSGSVEVVFDQFLTPLFGGLNAQATFIALDGDAGKNDGVSFKGVPLFNALNPVTDFGNSTISNAGVLLSGRNPAFSNTLGSDIDTYDVSAILANGDTSATGAFSGVAAETNFATLMGFQTTLYAPQITFELAVQDLNGGALVPGDILEYTGTVTNLGSALDGAVKVVLSDGIPESTTFVGGQLRLTASPAGGAAIGALTDAAGDDTGEFNANAEILTAFLGTGATTSAGGNLLPGTTAQIKFQVKIDADLAFNTTISNQAVVAFQGLTLSTTANSATIQVTSSDPSSGGPTHAQVVPPGGGGGGVSDNREKTDGSDPADADTDDDGLSDGAEPMPVADSDGDGAKNILDPDADNDGLPDGLELGKDCEGAGTNKAAGRCVADADLGVSKTDPLDRDSDKGGATDGNEDGSRNGRFDAGERNPNDPLDDNTVTDADMDGLSGSQEVTLGSDPQDADSDDDGLLDGLEPDPAVDTDGDGNINILDPDSDNDGLADGTEAGKDCANPATNKNAGRCIADADLGATKTSPIDADTDNGSVKDGAEDTNRNGKVDTDLMERNPNDPADDVAVIDTDMDGLPDTQEGGLGSNPNDADSDDDGLLDGLEPDPAVDTDRDGVSNINDPDSDDDGLFDGTEAGKDCANPATSPTAQQCAADADMGAATTNPLRPDTDGGGARDGAEDTNLDGKLDAGERNPNDPADDKMVVDADMDGLSDAEEAKLGSNPNDADTDDDGLLDGLESNPGVDTDKDGKTNILDPDADNDELKDGTEAGKDCASPATDATKMLCTADADKGVTTTRPLVSDTDSGGVSDGFEDKNLDGDIDNAEGNPNDPTDDKTLMVDTDRDGLSDDAERILGSDPHDADTDDDGALDGGEQNPGADADSDGVKNVLDADSDDDGIFDGTELGQNCDHPDTKPTTAPMMDACIPDADGGTTKTNPERNDSDAGTRLDGFEDLNKNGRIDAGETDPLDPSDDNPVVVMPPDPITPMPIEGSIGGGGIDCSFAAGAAGGSRATGTAWLLLAVGLGGVLVTRTRRRRKTGRGGRARMASAGGIALLLIATAALAPTRAMAQIDSGFALNRFQPSERGSDWFSLESLDLRGNGRFGLGLVADYASNPLVIYDRNGDEIAAPVENQLNLHLGGAVILRERVRIAASMPVAVLNNGDAGFFGPKRFALNEGVAAGDLRLGADLRLLGRYGQPFTLAVGVQAHIPTGRQSAYTTDGKLRLVPRLSAAGIAGVFTYAARVSFDARLRQDDFGGKPFGNEMGFAVAAGARLAGGTVVVGPEFFGSTVVNDGDAFAKESTSLEILFGGHVMIKRAWRVGLGGGPGINRAIGTPAVRLLAGLTYFPDHDDLPPPDRDGDGVLDRDDACPVTPGMKTADPATNGCPDSDGDGIVDPVDACPKEPGVASSDPKRHGCPPPVDTDGVGIFDHNDACPKEPGDPSDDPKKHGCPPPKDSDADGIFDPVDACPFEAGVASDDPKKHGCPPPPDSDGDGIADPDDACPKEAGVANPDPKKHGCPSDRDGDGIIDAVDACPDQAGDADPDPKKHGCPKVVITEKEITILERIEFDNNKATIRPVSDPILNAVLRVLKQHPEFTKVRIEGHTDDRGSNKHNTKLSQRRAESVVNWLFGGGIAKERMIPMGYGEDKPIADNKTADGRQTNRRVQFMILEKDGKPTGQ